jgi:hypothetical protein
MPKKKISNDKKNKKSNLEFNIYYISSNEYFKMNDKERIKKIITLLKNKNIIIIDTIIPPSDELEIIKEVINNVDNFFKGIEISTIRKSQSGLLNKILFKKEGGLTIIGPTNIVKRLEKQGENLIKMQV